MSAGFSRTAAVLSFRAPSFFPLIDEKTRIIKAPSDEGGSPQCRKNAAQRKKQPPLFGKAENKGAYVFTNADFYHRLFIEKALDFLRKALFLFIILFVCHAVKFAQLILLRF